MIVYIEVVILVDLIINLLTILIIKEITFIKLKKGVYLVFLIDIIYTILYLYKINLSYIKYLVPFIYIFFTFNCKFNKQLKLTFIYILLNFFLGGIVLSINISSNIIYLIIVLIYFFIFMFFLLFFKRKEISFYYKISFSIKGKKYVIDAFLDTGCSLFYKGYPVIVLNKKYDFNIYSDDYMVIHSATHKSYEKVYLLNELELNSKVIKCYCVFLDIEYNAIISSDII